MWQVRSLFRLSRTLLHLLQGVLTVALIFPWLSQNLRLSLKRRWSRQLLAMLGVRLRYRNNTAALSPAALLPHGLIVANHISFLDIFVLNAVAPAAFVSKDEVRQWPLIGWLSAKTDTLFLSRGSRQAAQKAREALVEQLRRGARVALFPEGTTSDGGEVLPFHSALLQAAIDAGVPVTPVALRYSDEGGARTCAPAYIDDVTLVDCLSNIAQQRTIYAEIYALPSLATVNTERRTLSAHAHRLIAHALEGRDGLQSAH